MRLPYYLLEILDLPLLSIGTKYVEICDMNFCICFIPGSIFLFSFLIYFQFMLPLFCIILYNAVTALEQGGILTHKYIYIYCFFYPPKYTLQNKRGVSLEI